MVSKKRRRQFYSDTRHFLPLSVEAKFVRDVLDRVSVCMTVSLETDVRNKHLAAQLWCVYL